MNTINFNINLVTKNVKSKSIVIARAKRIYARSHWQINEKNVFLYFNRYEHFYGINKLKYLIFYNFEEESASNSFSHPYCSKMKFRIKYIYTMIHRYNNSCFFLITHFHAKNYKIKSKDKRNIFKG